MKQIISASYKDDTPAFQSEEFFDALSKGRTASGISLGPEDVACIVFWTKNPCDHFLEHLHILDDMGIPYYIQWTISSYAKDIEPQVPRKAEVIERFRRLSRTIGADRIIWRYDPILINDTYTVAYHKKWFGHLCSNLKGYTHRCVVSFLDEYGKLKNSRIPMRAPNQAEILDICSGIAPVAAGCGITIQTCAERDIVASCNLETFGIHEAPCIDAAFIEQRFGIRLDDSIKQPDSFRRCLCARNTDIGQYRRCRHNCAYCYAN